MAKAKITNENKRVLVNMLNVPPRIAYWEVAEKLGIHENTLSKWMRRPNDEQTAQVKAAIDEIRAAQA